MTPFEIVVATSGSTVVLISITLWLARNLIQERLRAAIKHEYDTKLEHLKSDVQKETETAVATLRNQLERESSQDLARLQKDLDLFKQKELSGHHQKPQVYQLVFDVFAEIYSDLLIAFTQGQHVQVRDKYNRSWVRCYGYLSMIAPQDVMDAFDRLNDYALKVLSGSQLPQPWPQTRELALTFINSMRRDIGLDTREIEYHGTLGGTPNHSLKPTPEERARLSSFVMHDN